MDVADPGPIAGGALVLCWLPFRARWEREKERERPPQAGAGGPLVVWGWERSAGVGSTRFVRNVVISRDFRASL